MKLSAKLFKIALLLKESVRWDKPSLILDKEQKGEFRKNFPLLVGMLDNIEKFPVPIEGIPNPVDFYPKIVELLLGAIALYKSIRDSDESGRSGLKRTMKILLIRWEEENLKAKLIEFLEACPELRDMKNMITGHSSINVEGQRILNSLLA